MVVEYQMQMLVDGEWKHARYPTGQGYRYHLNPPKISTVEADIPKLRAEWEKNWNHNPKVPTDFRIVCRMVSDWQPIN